MWAVQGKNTPVSVGVALPFLVLFFIVPVLITVLALVDMFRHPRGSWDAAGENQLVWALVVIFVGVIGPILYLAIARPRLQRAEAGSPAFTG